MPPEIARIEQLGVARNQAIAALADIDRELKPLCVAAVRFGSAPILIAQLAGIARCKIDIWVDEALESTDD
jgi:hypothetical protein